MGEIGAGDGNFTPNPIRGELHLDNVEATSSGPNTFGLNLGSLPMFRRFDTQIFGVNLAQPTTNWSG